MDNLKQCTKCKEWKEKENFCKHKNLKDGLNPWCKQCVKEYRENNNVEVKCTYCNDWFDPTKLQLQQRLDAINGKSSKGAENRFYCSNKCKEECPTYRQIKYEKGSNPTTSREVQPQLRKLVLERDNWTCVKCNTHKDDLNIGLHCHHILSLNESPIESSDIDNCITLCKTCHKEVHKLPGCNYYELKC